MSSPIGQSTVIEGIGQAILSIEEQIRSQQVYGGQLPPSEEQEKGEQERGRRDKDGAVAAGAPPFPAQAPAPVPQASGSAYPGSYGALPPPSQPARQAAPKPAQDVLDSASLSELTLFVSRLRQIRDWLQQDSRLLPVVDEFIGQQVAASEKRNTRRNIAIVSITTVLGALLGWLLSSLATPSGLLSQIFAR